MNIRCHYSFRTVFRGAVEFLRGTPEWGGSAGQALDYLLKVPSHVSSDYPDAQNFFKWQFIKGEMFCDNVNDEVPELVCCIIIKTGSRNTLSPFLYKLG